MKSNNINSFQTSIDEKDSLAFKTLKRKFGFAGIGKYYVLKALIASEEDCLLDVTNEEDKMSLAEDLDFDIEQLDMFLDVLTTNCKLIITIQGKITTEDIQYTLSVVNEKRGVERKRKQEYRTKVKKLSDGTSQLSDGTSQLSDGTSQLSDGKTGMSHTRREGNEKDEREGKNSQQPSPSMEEKKEEFHQTVFAFDKDFDIVILNKFYKWWTQPSTQDKTKLAFEIPKIWDIKTRLEAWLEDEKNPGLKKQTNGNSARQYEKTNEAQIELNILS